MSTHFDDVRLRRRRLCASVLIPVRHRITLQQGAVNDGGALIVATIGAAVVLFLVRMVKRA